jgi:hypothetical protein
MKLLNSVEDIWREYEKIIDMAATYDNDKPLPMS